MSVERFSSNHPLLTLYSPPLQPLTPSLIEITPPPVATPTRTLTPERTSLTLARTVQIAMISFIAGMALQLTLFRRS